VETTVEAARKTAEAGAQDPFAIGHYPFATHPARVAWFVHGQDG
jgi:hypothetical protein